MDDIFINKNGVCVLIDGWSNLDLDEAAKEAIDEEEE
jgi:hypothetical protein